MEAFFAGLRYTTPMGFEISLSLPHLFLALAFLICTGLMLFLGVLLGRVNPCLFFGIYCAFLSMQNILPTFTGEAMWIPLMVFPGCFSAIGLYLLLTFILWLIDSDATEFSDEAKKIMAGLTAGAATALLGLFLYVFVTHNFLIIILVCGSLCALGILNQRKIIANGHRFKTYDNLYEIRLDNYTMQVKGDPDWTPEEEAAYGRAKEAVVSGQTKKKKKPAQEAKPKSAAKSRGKSAANKAEKKPEGKTFRLFGKRNRKPKENAKGGEAKHA